MAEQKAIRLGGGAEDLLLDATLPATVIQNRGVGRENMVVTKINSRTIPYRGRVGMSTFVSIEAQIDAVRQDSLVQRYGNRSLFPATGRIGTVYLDVTSDRPYVWDGTSYLPMSPTQFDTLTIGRNGAGDSILRFYDDNSNTTREITWDDSANAFTWEDNSGIKRRFATPASQAEVNANNSTKFMTGATLNGRTATTGRRGVVELSTDAENNAGTDGGKVVTPLGMANYVDVGSYTGVPPLSAFTTGKKDAIMDISTGKWYRRVGNTVREVVYAQPRTGLDFKGLTLNHVFMLGDTIHTYSGDFVSNHYEAVGDFTLGWSKTATGSASMRIKKNDVTEVLHSNLSPASGTISLSNGDILSVSTSGDMSCYLDIL